MLSQVYYYRFTITVGYLDQIDRARARGNMKLPFLGKRGPTTIASSKKADEVSMKYFPSSLLVFSSLFFFF